MKISFRARLEEQISIKNEEYLQETAKKEEQLRKTVDEYEDRLYELQEKSTNSSENMETPRVIFVRFLCRFENIHFSCQLEFNLAYLNLEALLKMTTLSSSPFRVLML